MTRITLSFAAWFHDAVYTPRALDNEKRSADLAEAELSRLGISPERRNKVKKLILETKSHEVSESDTDAQFFMDADMSILGADKETYDRYAKNIKEEYAEQHSGITPDVFKRGRKSILEGFLKRSRIFLTDTMHDRYEQRARGNIGREIASHEV